MLKHFSTWCFIVIIGMGTLMLTTRQASAQGLPQTFIVRVDGIEGSANPPGEGDDWEEDAYLYLQDALVQASALLSGAPTGSTVQVWVRGATGEGARRDALPPRLDRDLDRAQAIEGQAVAPGFELAPLRATADRKAWEN